MNRFEIPRIEGISCKNCDAACCRAWISMKLSEIEATTIRSAGTIITPVAPADSRRDTRRTYLFSTDCGHLIKGEAGKTLCAIHGSSDQPLVCRDFPAGGTGCKVIRKIHFTPEVE